MARATVAPAFTRWHERFADGFGRRPKGELEPFAADYDLDSIGTVQLPLLAATEAAVLELLGGGRVTLGRLQSRFDVSATVTRLGLEYGLTRRITLGGVLPMVRFRNEVSVNPNPLGTEANVGLNPAVANATARTLNSQVVTQLTAAAQQLQARLASCMGSSDPTCTAINADRARAAQVVAAATSTAGGIENLYGVSAAKPGQRFAPVARGSLAKAVGAKLSSLSTDFATLLGAPTGTTAWIDARPADAPPIAFADLQTLVTDADFGIEADSLISVEFSHPGDAEFGAKVLLLDTFGGRAPQLAAGGGVKLRLAVAGAYRVATGIIRSPNSFADLGTGDGQDDIEARVFADLMFGRRFWVTAAGRYVYQRPDVQDLRVPTTAHQPFPAASRLVSVSRDLGDIMAVEFSPRLVISGAIGVSASYSYLKKASDALLANEASFSSIAPDMSLLESGTARTEQRAAFALTYSTMAAYYGGRARLPMEVSYTLGRTVAADGNAPRQFITALMLRLYKR
jgi:hypothetical protein